MPPKVVYHLPAATAAQLRALAERWGQVSAGAVICNLAAEACAREGIDLPPGIVHKSGRPRIHPIIPPELRRRPGRPRIRPIPTGPKRRPGRPRKHPAA